MSKQVEVKIVNKSNNALPKYETLGSAGMDVRAFMDKDFALLPGERTMIHTGIYVSIPVGYVIKVHARSGLAYKHGIIVTNGVGVIDSDYRGECNVLLYNSGKETLVIKNGDRIAQFVLEEVPSIIWDEVTTLDSTIRGKGGFGHTGV